jgi:NTE family protein
MSEKRALVLSGGASRGVFQAGVLRYLLDKENVEYDIYSGVSVGALNASLLATGPLKETLPELEKIWLEEIKGNRSVWKHHLWWYILAGIGVIVLFIACAFISFIFDMHKAITITLFVFALFSVYFPFFSLKNAKSIYNTDPLRKIIENKLDINKLRNSGKSLCVGAVSYETGEYKTGTQNDDNIVDWILASSAFPLFFPMVKIGNQHFTDGGVINVAPLYDALKLGATQIDIIICSPLDAGVQTQLGLPIQFERTLDVMHTEILSNDITICKSHTNVRVFMPLKNFEMSSLSFDPEKIKKVYDMGKEAAMNRISV